jgi:hypothetical protein
MEPWTRLRRTLPLNTTQSEHLTAALSARFERVAHTDPGKRAALVAGLFCEVRTGYALARSSLNAAVREIRANDVSR